MKKVSIIHWHKAVAAALLLLMSVIAIYFMLDTSTNQNAEAFLPQTYFKPGQSPEGSEEEIYRDIFTF